MRARWRSCPGLAAPGVAVRLAAPYRSPPSQLRGAQDALPCCALQLCNVRGGLRARRRRQLPRTSINPLAASPHSSASLLRETRGRNRQGEGVGVELQSCACPSGWASAGASLRHRGRDARPQPLRGERRLFDGSGLILACIGDAARWQARSLPAGGSRRSCEKDPPCAHTFCC